MLNAMMEDLGFRDPTGLVTKDKVRRLKIQHGFGLQVEHEEAVGFQFLGFDGRSNNVSCKPILPNC